MGIYSSKSPLDYKLSLWWGAKNKSYSSVKAATWDTRTQSQGSDKWHLSTRYMSHIFRETFIVKWTFSSDSASFLAKTFCGYPLNCAPQAIYKCLTTKLKFKVDISRYC